MPRSQALHLAGNRIDGAQFEILVDGKPRSYRDTKIAAIEAAAFLKSRQPHSEVAVKDLQSGVLTVAVNHASCPVLNSVAPSRLPLWPWRSW